MAKQTKIDKAIQALADEMAKHLQAIAGIEAAIRTIRATEKTAPKRKAKPAAEQEG